MVIVTESGPGVSNVYVDSDLRHALAALALYGQPFGFTWDDVDRIRMAAMYYPGEMARALDGIGDRIAALLPPRGERRDASNTTDAMTTETQNTHQPEKQTRSDEEA
jgi:hypothetical protein